MRRLFRADKLKIGNHTYLVDLVAGHRNKDDEVVYGECDRNYKRITLNSDFPEEVLFETLMHEVTHAIMYESCADMFIDDDTEEKIVITFAKGLYRFLLDNQLDE